MRDGEMKVIDFIDFGRDAEGYRNINHVVRLDWTERGREAARETEEDTCTTTTLRTSKQPPMKNKADYLFQMTARPAPPVP